MADWAGYPTVSRAGGKVKAKAVRKGSGTPPMLHHCW